MKAFVVIFLTNFYKVFFEPVIAAEITKRFTINVKRNLADTLFCEPQSDLNIELLILEKNNFAARSVSGFFFLFRQKALRDEKFDDGAGIVAREFVGE